MRKTERRVNPKHRKLDRLRERLEPVADPFTRPWGVKTSG